MELSPSILGDMADFCAIDENRELLCHRRFLGRFDDDDEDGDVSPVLAMSSISMEGIACSCVKSPDIFEHNDPLY
jgi:hypothetical protein